MIKLTRTITGKQSTAFPQTLEQTKYSRFKKGPGNDPDNVFHRMKKQLEGGKFSFPKSRYWEV